MDEREDTDIPEDERVTVPDLSKVFDDVGEAMDDDPFDPDAIPSDDQLPEFEDPDADDA